MIVRGFMPFMHTESLMKQSSVSGEDRWGVLPARLARYVPLVAALIAVVAIIAVPLAVTSRGFAPEDDLLRDVAKAVSGRAWGDVMLLRPGLNPNLRTHPGWDTILSAVHGLGIGKDQLLVFGIVFLAFVAFLPGVVFLRRPEISLILLGALPVLEFGVMHRYFTGRPYLIDVACTSSILFLWEAFERNPARKRMLLTLVALLALRVWIRSTLIMLGIPLLAVFASAWIRGRWKPAGVFFGCVAAGIALGTLLTGAPVEFLTYNFKHFYWTLFRREGVQFVVQELEPLKGNVSLFVLVLGYVFVSLSGGTRRERYAHPAFILGLLGWVLSFTIVRFWFEYGLPAMLVWIALDLQDRIEPRMRTDSPARLLLSIFAAMMFGFAVLLPHRAAWQENPIVRARAVRELYETKPDRMPGKGGVLYAATMRVFFVFFYLFPDAPWQYATGMEAGFMPVEDLRVYEDVNMTGEARLRAVDREDACAGPVGHQASGGQRHRQDLPGARVDIRGAGLLDRAAVAAGRRGAYVVSRDGQRVRYGVILAAAVAVAAVWLSPPCTPGGVLGRLGYGRFVLAVSVTCIATVAAILACISPARRRTWAFRVAAVVVSVLGILGAAELAAWFLPPIHIMDNPFYINASPDRDDANPDLPFRRPAHLEWRGLSRGDLAILNQEPDPYARVITFRTDHEGFRNNRDLRQAGIVLLGDSFTEAGNIPEEETFAWVAAAMLGETGRNLGVSGYAPPIERIVLERFGLDMNPRIVVWQIAENNDLKECVRYRNWLAHGRPRVASAEDPGRLSRRDSWRRRSPSYRTFVLLRRAPAWLRGPSGMTGTADGHRHPIRFLFTPDPALDAESHPGFVDLVSALEAGQELLAARGIRLLVCLVPMKFRAMAPVTDFEHTSRSFLEARGLQPPDWDVPKAAILAEPLSRFCAGKGIEFLDLTPALREAAQAGTLVYQPFDTHLTAAGHRIVAEAIAGRLSEDAGQTAEGGT